MLNRQIHWYQQQKLIHQIGGVILIGFFVSFILSLYLLSYDKTQRLSQLSISGAIQRVISVADTLERTPDTLHSSILNASSSSDLRLSVTDYPKVPASSSPDDVEKKWLQRLHQIGVENVHISLVSQQDRPLMDLSAQDMNVMHRAMMGEGRMMGKGAGLVAQEYSATIDGSIKLTSGQWLNFSSGIENKMTHWSSGILVALITVMIVTVVISLLVIRRALRPVRDLGIAAQSFARNKQVSEVSTKGASDVVPTILAFNNMQRQVTDYIQERTKLLAAISHDLRTPLTSLRLRMEFIDESEDKEQLLKTIDTMDKMLTATMRFAKNDANQEKRQVTDIDSLLLTIIDEYDEKGVEISYTCQHGLVGNIPPVTVRRMTENLINNAIQYAGRDAHIGVSVQVNDERLKICVFDDGIGIPQDKLKEVLKPFTRLDEARDTDTSNVGLGLSITHSLASAYGGSLSLEANQPHGLKAIVTIALI